MNIKNKLGDIGYAYIIMIVLGIIGIIFILWIFTGGISPLSHKISAIGNITPME